MIFFSGKKALVYVYLIQLKELLTRFLKLILSKIGINSLRKKD
jgi:hypothetical protein